MKTAGRAVSELLASLSTTTAPARGSASRLSQATIASSGGATCGRHSPIARSRGCSAIKDVRDKPVTRDADGRRPTWLVLVPAQAVDDEEVATEEEETPKAVSDEFDFGFVPMRLAA